MFSTFFGGTVFGMIFGFILSTVLAHLRREREISTFIKEYHNKDIDTPKWFDEEQTVSLRKF